MNNWGPVAKHILLSPIEWEIVPIGVKGFPKDIPFVTSQPAVNIHDYEHYRSTGRMNEMYRIYLNGDYQILDCNKQDYPTISKCIEVVNQSILAHNRKIKIEKILLNL